MIGSHIEQTDALMPVAVVGVTVWHPAKLSASTSMIGPSDILEMAFIGIPFLGVGFVSTGFPSGGVDAPDAGDRRENSGEDRRKGAAGYQGENEVHHTSSARIRRAISVTIPEKISHSGTYFGSMYGTTI